VTSWPDSDLVRLPFGLGVFPLAFGASLLSDFSPLGLLGLLAPRFPLADFGGD
jgi:hypothetical protein